MSVGGKSVTLAQLEQMRDSGVDIECHTVSHHDLRHASRSQNYAAWLHNEIYRSKDILEKKLGIKILAFAFPYGTHNEMVRKMAMEAGGGEKRSIQPKWRVLKGHRDVVSMWRSAHPMDAGLPWRAWTDLSTLGNKGLPIQLF